MMVLAHGWGFSPRFWDRMAAHLPPCERLDFGFFGPPAVVWPDEPFTLVGHSFGALWGLLHAPAHGAVVAINGFARFPGGRALDRMIARFDAEPEAVLTAFQQRCGAAPHTAGNRPAALRAALRLLRDGEAGVRAPKLAIHGTADPLLARPDFAAAHLLPGGHLLPLTHPAECAALVLARR